MTAVSNKYATKLFSEHPISIWPLDDDVHFISLIDQNERDLSGWTLTNCAVESENPNLPDAPSPFTGDAEYFEIVGDYLEFVSSDGIIELKSDSLFSFNNLNQTLKTISLNFYLFQDSSKVSKYEFGIEYFDSTLNTDIQILSTIDPASSKSWIRFIDTFEVNEFDADTCKIVLKIYVTSGGAIDEYRFIMNALSIGQWSETFSSKSLGAIPQTIEVSGTTVLNGVAADQYGPASDNAYYIVQDDNLLLAKNEGVPIVFGSENSTSIIAPDTENVPSLIFPGSGFMSNSGKNNLYTLEFWMRIKPNTKEYRRIFGPIGSDYGIYVSEGFITLLIGNKFQTHNIDEWYRPMIIHLIYSSTNLRMLINGEEVIGIDIDEEIDFSNNEWIAFYGYSDIDVFEIDCISLFPYSIPLKVATRRFVWGQGTESQEEIDSSFQGETTNISFTNANYSSNILYPDKERWDAGHYNNLIATTSSISVPQYTLPEIFLDGRSVQLWYDANKKVNEIEYPSGNHPKFLTFRPNLTNNETQWQRTGPDWNEKSYLKFTSSNILSAPISTMYGVFEIEDDISADRVLVHIVSSRNSKRFEINVNGNEVVYKFDGNELLSPIDFSSQEHIVVGFNIPKLSETFGPQILDFFSSYESLTIYVGGAPDTEDSSYETFEGKIYKFAFADYSNFDSIKNHFNDNGIAKYDDDSFFEDHYSTYAVMPFVKYNRFFLDISISANWEEYYPLSYFANYAFDASGSQYYGLDFLQFNIGYPSFIEKIQQVFSEDNWENYYDLQSQYEYPIRKNYEILDNSNITGYQNYGALELNEVTKTVLDTSKSSMDIFATFQLISEGANEPINSFTYTKELQKDISIDPSLENTSSDIYKAYKTKFRIIDGTIVYPPKNIKLEELALVIHFSVNQDAILSSPLKVRNMEIAAKTLNVTKPNPIGTKFGNEIYPYTKSGIYFNYKNKNPFLIYKKNTPYLYFTENSGIKLLGGQQDVSKEYGISIPVNKNKRQPFYMAAAQLFIKSEIDEPIYAPFPIFEISSPQLSIEFIAEIDDSDLRYKITARDKITKTTISDISFYQNGISVNNPFLLKNKWSSISFILKTPVDFGNSGSINIFPGFLFNNVSVYPVEAFNQIAAIVPNIWSKILYVDPDGDINDPNNIYDWQNWIASNWEDLFIAFSENRYSLGPANIYSAYTGTNIEVIDDDSGINFINDDFAIFSDLVWSNSVGKPV